MKRLGLLVAILAVALAASPAIAVDGFTSDPENLTLSGTPARGVEGDQVKIEGAGWPAQTEIAIQTCGNLGLRGSSDCDIQNTTLTVTNRRGQLATFHTVTSPPVDCPCSIKVEAISQIEEGYVAYELEGHPVSELVRPPDPALQTLEVDAKLVGSGPWTAWLGFAPRRTLELTLTNLSNAPVTEAPLVVRSGRGDSALEIVDTLSYPIPEIPPGRTATVEIPVSLSGPAWGAYTVAGEVGVFPRQAEFTTETSDWPWLGLALLFVLLQIPIFKGRNWARARFAEVSEASAMAAAPPQPAPVPAAVPAAAPAAVAVAPDGNGVVPMPVPVVLGADDAWSAHVPVSFQPVPAGQAPIVTVSFEPSAPGDTTLPRISGITIGGDIELRLRAVPEAGIDDEHEEGVGS